MAPIQERSEKQRMSFPFQVGREKVSFYINIPYCSVQCTYCHYAENIEYGHRSVPDDYVNVLMEQISTFCEDNELCDTELFSCYFGGGTPSLLSHEQLQGIIGVFRRYNLTFREKTIEIYPTTKIEKILSLGFFNRFSIGVQSLGKSQLRTWKRPVQTQKYTTSLIEAMRKAVPDGTINLDYIFFTDVNPEELADLCSLGADSLVLYPMTGKRDELQTAQTYSTLLTLDSLLPGYNRDSHVSSHFFKKGCQHSLYAQAQYYLDGTIVGFGHNSLSFQEESSYLSQRDDSGRFIVTHRNGNWAHRLFYGSLLYGVADKVLQRETCALKHFLKEKKIRRMELDLDTWEQASKLVKEQNPEDEVLFYSSLFFSDRRPKNMRLFFRELAKQLLAKNFRINFVKMIPDWSTLSLKDIPCKRILVEGIDGSGKDSFIELVVSYLKRLSLRTGGRSISISGDPSSSSRYGAETKAFIETGIQRGSYEDIKHKLHVNRKLHHATLLREYPGLQFFIRSVLTEAATLHILNPMHSTHSIDTGDFDMCIFIKVDPEVARERILQREIPTSWREELECLKDFAAFFESHISETFNHIVVDNTSNSLELLHGKAAVMAYLIYNQFYDTKIYP